VNVLGSIASQLARQNQQCFIKLQGYYDECNPEESLLRPPKVAGLKRLICDMLTHFDEAAILVDGLDECGNSTIEVVTLLVDLADTSTNMKTLFASRDLVHIRELLDSYCSVSIAARSSDLRLYVASEIENRIRLNRLRIGGEKIKEHIMDKLINGAEGM
jgi:hypothetical protein